MKTVNVGKKLFVELVEECTENIDKAKKAGEALFKHRNECLYSYTICVVFAVITLAISIGIVTYFAYKYMHCNKKMFLNMIMSIK